MYLISIYIFCFGLIIGSFLNALIWRLHSGESMMTRSMCPKCKHQLAWFDNIPVLSFVFLRGKCRYCSERISWQYPAVESITALLFLLSAVQVMTDYFVLSTYYFLLKSWFLISVMIVIFVYDLRWYLILDKVTIPASIILFCSWIIENWYFGNLFKFSSWSLLIASTAVGYGFFAIQYYGSKGKWLGGGDVKLGLLMALALATPSKIIAAIFIAYVMGAIVGISLIALRKKELSSKLPFGTCLAAATVAVLLYGEAIINWYLKIAGF